jgi:hypothetical protein
MSDPSGTGPKRMARDLLTDALATSGDDTTTVLTVA